MIEKLVIQKLTIAGKEYEYPDTTALVGKFNELADVVNALIKENNIHEMQIDELQMKAEPQKCEPQDIYAEQRKWIGKLCRCWDSDINDDVWGILQDIKDNKIEKYYLYGIGYEHCEPVKPDDDIIYKGGKDE